MIRTRTTSTRSDATPASPTNELVGLALELGRLRIERDQARAQVSDLEQRIERLEELVPKPPPREGADDEHDDDDDKEPQP